ncbi:MULTISPECIES: heavy-metal-associated domain-containing protein [Pseudomonas]|jgi:copper chaperone|uniref:Copper chaperone n=1 Tax=Pseudomonas psychrophila TaxID=122355 RepID=A0A8I1FSD5_9PSED|nr:MULTISPECIES: heavy-metal-associated domain-containing protein [Pseudomonas]EPJ93706.1 heavy metal transport/detoxification protein [Pseudomonas psychrophila]KAB0489171.1 heavy-metal-associated domain-containing protein [Pseudomonas psychrophila]KMM98114.1 heavy metal transporter [Pseudomonas psychrophila]KOX67072.1 heavy metal transporter [Pseudomonas psychrophila]MBJ2259852.1 heavy-metal-associated domain-containing protein [Pseudomonas psychrophila]
MQTFKVEGMTCGGCVGAVTRAVQAVDKDAKVEVDLASKTVKVDSKVAPLQIIDVITNAGFEARTAH